MSGASVFVNATAVRAFGDPVLFTTLKNGVAAVLLMTIALPRAWIVAAECAYRAGTVGVGRDRGSVAFVLFFSGLAEATAPRRR